MNVPFSTVITIQAYTYIPYSDVCVGTVYSVDRGIQKSNSLKE